MKKKRFIFIVFILLILFIIVGISLFIKKDTNIKLNNTNFVFEYGDKVPFDVSYYIDEKDNSKIEKSEIRFQYDYMIEIKEDEIRSLSSDYLKVGIYELYIEYSNKQYNFTIEVKDTTPPEFIDFKEEIEIEKDTKNLDLSDFYAVKDLNSTTIVVESDVDVNTVGEYKALIKAKDYYGNITEKEAVIKVIEKEVKETSKKNSESTKTSSPATNTSSKQTNSGNKNNNSNSSNKEQNNNSVASATYRRDIANTLVNKINEYRKNNGLPELPVTSETQAIADQRAKEIVTNPSHDGSVYGYGENIGGGGIGTDFFDLWKNSFAHNNTLLRDQNTTIAVSIYQVNNMWYAVAVFKLDY